MKRINWREKKNNVSKYMLLTRETIKKKTRQRVEWMCNNKNKNIQHIKRENKIKKQQKEHTCLQGNWNILPNGIIFKYFICFVILPKFIHLIKNKNKTKKKETIVTQPIYIICFYSCYRKKVRLQTFTMQSLCRKFQQHQKKIANSFRSHRNDAE